MRAEMVLESQLVRCESCNLCTKGVPYMDFVCVCM